MQSSYGVEDYLNESAQGVKLFLGILIVIALARNANAHPVGHILDPLAPQIFVELLIYPHIAGAHHLLGELAHLGNGTGCPGLEGPVRYRTDICHKSTADTAAKIQRACTCGDWAWAENILAHQTLVHVDGVLACDDVIDARSLLVTLLGHGGT